MIIKVSEKTPGKWSLWVQDKPGDDQPPTHTASGRTHDEIGALLVTIIQANAAWAHVVPEPPARTKGSAVSASLTRSVIEKNALYAFLSVLDGWIEGAKENHGALGHRCEDRGSECWRSFDPTDIRRMINDTCRELGITEFPIPSPGVEG